MAVYHWFWGLLTIAMLVWYTFITIYIAYRGIFDIRGMLDRLSAGDHGPDSSET